MRTSAIILAAFIISGCGAASRSFPVGTFLNGAAKKLQKRLPSCASFDGLVEARRGSGEWTYRFWIDADKTTATEVRIRLAQSNAYSSNLDVEVVKLRGGLFFDSEEHLPSQSLEWTNRIKALLGPEGAADGCAALYSEESAHVD